jgi:hypothetical protein
MTGIVDKVKNALHSDKHDSSTTHGTSTHGTTSHGTTTGSSTNYENPQSSNSGPHASNLANKADPRIDSDNSKSGYGHQGTTTGVGSGTTSGYGTSGTHNNAYGSTNAGPHDSNLANKADPRVDSDRDGSHNTHNTHTSHNTGVSSGVGTSHAHGTAGTNHGSTFAGQTTSGSTTAGPHSSNVANKLDPRVDSDRDGSRNAGAASGTSGYSGTHTGNNVGGNTGYGGGVSHSTNAGPHDSNIANKADPRVDSDLDGRGNRHGASTGGTFGTSGSHATAGSGTAQNTAGPHNSDMLNKLDPRVDSDRDGSKTVGGNATHH